jgi:hypothetical protein
MKRIAQIILFGFVIILLISFNKLYFANNDQIKKEVKISFDDQLIDKKTNNTIKNLTYEVKIGNKFEYKITSDLSEITNSNNQEIIKMNKVEAKIIDVNNIPLIINSEYADYNKVAYNTKFRKDVSLKYLNNTIYADKIDIDFQTNKAKIFQNVKYEGSLGTIKSDNIEINFLTKKIDIFMNNENEKINITKN